jgi:uncharacterized damage-inducible protein DinB
MSDIATSYAKMFHNSFFGEAWHGPSLMEVLDGLDAAAARARPLPSGHSIWELVNHIHAWNRAFLVCFHGKAVTLQMNSAGDFPQPRDTSEAAWRRTLDELVATENELEKTVAAMTDEALNQIVPGRNYDFHHLCTGLPHHFSYHGGQISLLKKAALAGKSANHQPTSIVEERKTRRP